MRVVQHTPMPDGSVMEEKGESIRRKRTLAPLTARLEVSAGNEPEIIRRQKFLVMGTLTRIAPGTESGDKFGSIWSEFEAHREQIKPHSTDQEYYGISFAPGDDGGFDYVAGMAVLPVQTTPTGLVVREVPAATYAVFACAVAAIGSTKQYVFTEWRSKSGYQVDTAAPAFERYPPANDTRSPVLICIPVREQRPEARE
jgi:AraC family transcriptional regulator